jgi:hypothetical protein
MALGCVHARGDGWSSRLGAIGPDLVRPQWRWGACMPEAMASRLGLEPLDLTWSGRNGVGVRACQGRWLVVSAWSDWTRLDDQAAMALRCAPEAMVCRLGLERLDLT